MYYCVAIFICVLDQFSKFCVNRLVLQGSSTPVIRDVFHITLVHNTGAAFGMLGGCPLLFIAISILAVFFINYFLIKKRHVLNAPEKWALCFILGGTLGNLIDRIRTGCVVDFIDLRIWPVFNLADSFITIGAVMLGWSILTGVRKRDQGKR